jgi:maleate isomerase
MIRLLPLGIGIVPVYLNFTEGTRQEMQNSYANYEKNVAYLASQHCDTISIEGAPAYWDTHKRLRTPPPRRRLHERAG